jgi:hypothetical protein
MSTLSSASSIRERAHPTMLPREAGVREAGVQEGGLREGAARAEVAVASARTKSRHRHTPGGAGLGQAASREAQRLAAVVLEVLAGARTPTQAAEALAVSLPRYFQLETRAMRALVAGCEARPRGPGRSLDKELTLLRRQHERLQRELGRQQALVRLAQRTIGLAPPKAEPPGPARGKKRRRRPVVRALRAAAHLQRQSGAPAATTMPAGAVAAQPKESI